MLSMQEQNALVEQVRDLGQRRDWPEIVRLLKDLPEEDLLGEPSLAFRLALAHVSLGAYAEARRLHALLVPICLPTAEDVLYRRLVLLKGNIHLFSGDLPAAAEQFNELLALASTAEDPVLQAGAVLSMGIVATIRCEWDEAIAAYGRAQAAYQQIGRRASVAVCHQNLGMTYRQIGAFTESQTHFEHALTFRPHLSRLSLAAIESERAYLLSLMGDRVLAERLVRRNLASVERLGVESAQGEQLRLLGMILSGRDRHEARACFTRSLQIAQRLEIRLLQAEVHEELAVLAAQEGDRDAAASEAAESARLFWLMGAEAHAERVWRRLADAPPREMDDGSR